MVGRLGLVPGLCCFQLPQGQVGFRHEEPVSHLGYLARQDLCDISLLCLWGLCHIWSANGEQLYLSILMCTVQLLTKKAGKAPKFPFIRAYPPRGYETALTRLLLQSSLCNNLELWNFAELLW